MSNATQILPARKSAYKRPYKTRGQRRERNRRKHDESKEHKFLLRIVVVVGIVILVAAFFAVQGMSELNQLTETATK